MAVMWNCQTSDTAALTALMLTSVLTVTRVSIVIYVIFLETKGNYKRVYHPHAQGKSISAFKQEINQFL